MSKVKSRKNKRGSSSSKKKRQASRKKNVIRNFKGTVFRMLFNNKKALLSLYNAVNDTSYDNEEDLEITTLENAIYMSMKNDVSCIIDMQLQLYEQQSTINPNMPIRNLMYITRQLEKLVVKKDLYGKTLVKIPTPKFIVFYNGTELQPEQRTLLLSEAFENSNDEINLELKVLQLNINKSYNETIKAKCPELFQYMEYVDTVRRFHKNYPLEDAVRLAVDYCIAHDILREFLLANKVEVTSMSIFEYDEELHKKTLLKEGFDEGYDKGYDKGLEDGLSEANELINEKDKIIADTLAENARLKAQLAERAG